MLSNFRAWRNGGLTAALICVGWWVLPATAQNPTPTSTPHMVSKASQCRMWSKMGAEFYKAHDYYSAAVMYRKALTVGNSPGITADERNLLVTNLACACREGGDSADAGSLFKQAMNFARRVYPPCDPALDYVARQYSNFLIRQGDEETAALVMEQSVTPNQREAVMAEAAQMANASGVPQRNLDKNMPNNQAKRAKLARLMDDMAALNDPRAKVDQLPHAEGTDNANLRRQTPYDPVNNPFPDYGPLAQPTGTTGRPAAANPLPPDNNPVWDPNTIENPHTAPGAPMPSQAGEAPPAPPLE